MKRVLAVGIALLALMGIGQGTRVPYTINPHDQALLRLSWRMKGERKEHCHKLSDAELEKLPPHMRMPELCEEDTPDFRLSLQLDGRTYPEEVLHAAGAHADRPIYVLREIHLRPGKHSLAVSFSAVREPGEHSLTLARDFTAKTGDVVLVTTDPLTGALTLR